MPWQEDVAIALQVPELRILIVHGMCYVFQDLVVYLLAFAPRFCIWAVILTFTWRFLWKRCHSPPLIKATGLPVPPGEYYDAEEIIETNGATMLALRYHMHRAVIIYFRLTGRIPLELE